MKETLLQKYAREHGASEKAFIDAGWVETKYSGFPALKFPTDGGDRYRIFGGGNKYAGKGNKQVWYRLEEAVKIAFETDIPLIIVNGEASVVAAQSHNLPATAVTMGEKKIPDELIAQLKDAYKAYPITVAFDNDDTGKAATKKVVKQLSEAGFTPLYVEWDSELSSGYDFADYLRDNSRDNTITLLETASFYAEPVETKQSQSVALMAYAGDAETMIKAAIANTFEGSRNANGFKLAMELRKMGVSKESAIEYGLKYQKAVTDKGDEPYTETEIRNSIESAYNRPAETVVKINGNTPKSIAPLLHEIGYTFRYNDLNDEIEVNGEFHTDRIAKRYCSALANMGVTSERMIELAVATLAEANHYHPIKEYLTNLEWDGEDHIAKVAQTFVAPDDETGTANELFFRRWLISVVAKSLDEKQNVMLVFNGPQGIGKSSFAKWLASGLHEDYFLDQRLNLEDKDTEVRSMSVWIWEVGELGATTRKVDYEALKNFITKQRARVRKSHDKKDTIKPVSASYIGTVNDDGIGFLVDPTGNRRFMIVELEKIDYSYRDVDVNQLWAQAVALYKAGESYELSATEKELQETINTKHEYQSPLEDILRDRYEADAHGRVYTNTIVEEILDISHAYGNAVSISREIARVFSKMGAKKKQEKGGSRYWTVKERKSGFQPA